MGSFFLTLFVMGACAFSAQTKLDRDLGHPPGQPYLVHEDGVWVRKVNTANGKVITLLEGKTKTTEPDCTKPGCSCDETKVDFVPPSESPPEKAPSQNYCVAAPTRDQPIASGSSAHAWSRKVSLANDDLTTKSSKPMDPEPTRRSNRYAFPEDA